MSTIHADASPRLKARIAGVCYLTTMACGVFALQTRSGLVIKTDTAATAANILAAEPIFRLSILADLVGIASYVAVTALLYELLSPAGRTAARMAAFFSITGCAIGGGMTLALMATLLLLGDSAPYLAAAFPPEQLQAAARAGLKLHSLGYTVGMVNFAVYCVLMGVLVFRSGFLPRILGILLTVGGLAYAVDTWTTVTASPLEMALYPYVMAAGFLGEGALTLWLLAFGVNPERWRERAAARL